MKRTKRQKRFEYLAKIIEIAYDECDLDHPNFVVSNLVFSGQPCTVLTASSTDRVTVQAFLPDSKSETWDGSVAVGFGKMVISSPLTKLIDTLQSIKDEHINEKQK